MSASWAGAMVGLLLACSVLLVISRLLATAPLTLRERITPFVPALRAESVERRPSAIATVLALLPFRNTSRWPGGGVDGDPLERMAFLSLGTAIGALVGLVLALRGSTPLLVLVLAAIGAVAGELVHSNAQARRRRALTQRIDAELADIAELLAFSVAAGESPSAAVARLGEMSSGALGALLRRAAAEARLGTPFEMAMRDLVSASGSAEAERFVDALLVAMERGTPLADLLRAQAADARAAQSRRLMESAGRKDIAMLVPIVFLILPTVVLIALFPGFRSLHLFIN